MNYGISGCWNTRWCGHPRLMPVPALSVTAQRSRLSNISKAQLCQRHVILVKTPRKGFKLNISWSGEVYWAMSLPGAARRSKGKGKNNQKCGGRDWINVLPPGSPVTIDDAGGLIVTIWILAQTNTMSGPWQQEHGHWFWWQPAPLTSVTASHTAPSCLLTLLLPHSQLLLSFLIKISPSRARVHLLGSFCGHKWNMGWKTAASATRHSRISQVSGQLAGLEQPASRRKRSFCLWCWPSSQAHLPLPRMFALSLKKKAGALAARAEQVTPA